MKQIAKPRAAPLAKSLCSAFPNAATTPHPIARRAALFVQRFFVFMSTRVYTSLFDKQLQTVFAIPAER
jgi:hypothetical protein